MTKEKNQTARIIDGFVTAVVIITAVSLVASGIAVSKINSEYLETGVRTAKIVAERKNEQIFLSESDNLLISSGKTADVVQNVLKYLPPPVNTIYLAAKEFKDK